MIIPTREKIQEINNKALGLKKKTEELIQNHNYPEIIKLYSENETKTIAGMNRDIYIFGIVSLILEDELRNKQKCFLEGSSFDEAIRLFRISSLLLRRIEFEFPMELQVDILTFIQQEEISMDFIFGVIKNNKAIVEKQKVISRFRELLTKVLADE